MRKILKSIATGVAALVSLTGCGYHGPQLTRSIIVTYTDADEDGKYEQVKVVRKTHGSNTMLPIFMMEQVTTTRLTERSLSEKLTEEEILSQK